MDTWTREELETAYPLGTVYKQTDDDVEPLTAEEWSEWIDGQVGMPKHPVSATGPTS